MSSENFQKYLPGRIFNNSDNFWSGDGTYVYILNVNLMERKNFIRVFLKIDFFGTGCRISREPDIRLRSGWIRLMYFDIFEAFTVSQCKKIKFASRGDKKLDKKLANFSLFLKNTRHLVNYWDNWKTKGSRPQWRNSLQNASDPIAISQLVSEKYYTPFAYSILITLFCVLCRRGENIHIDTREDGKS